MKMKIGFFDNFVPLTNEDVQSIVNVMKKLDNNERFLIDNWKI